MKGIVLAGGTGSRLFPSTISTSKQLIPIYDKPMIFYPISILMLSGIKDILIISTPNDINRYKKLLGDGSDLGIHFSYCIQENPDGLASSFIIGKDFIGTDDVVLILGDNIFYGQDFSSMLNNARLNLKKKEATIFSYFVKSPSEFGVVELDKNNKAISIEEKPVNPKSNYAVTGLYFYPNDVIENVKFIKPSKRGELEITSLNNKYLLERRLNVEKMGRGFVWLDTGTHESLIQASNFVYSIEKNTGFKIACLEEIAFNMEYIGANEINKAISKYNNSIYGEYLNDLLN